MSLLNVTHTSYDKKEVNSSISESTQCVTLKTIYLLINSTSIVTNDYSCGKTWTIPKAM